MKNKKELILISSTLLLSIVLFPRNCFAYLDPGSGSFILQIIIGFLLGGLFLLKSYWTKFKLFLSKLFSKKQQDKDNK